MELECRQEEEDITVGIDLDTASQKSMAKLVNKVRGLHRLLHAAGLHSNHRTDSLILLIYLLASCSHTGLVFLG